MREDKPVWSAVPPAVRNEAERMLGASVTRAVRAFGGYGPSATFVLTLIDGRRAFFKGIYPLPEGSAVHWMLDEEERVYQELGEFIAPWAPAYYGSIRLDGWHALLIEAVPGERVPPWTRDRAERAVRSYAHFHATTVDRPLPEWLPRDGHLEFTQYWTTIAADDGVIARVASLCPSGNARDEAGTWLSANVPALARSEQLLVAATRFALLHSDTRSDNVRVDGQLLRMFDWPFAFVGPPEFDLAAFAQSIAGEGGPSVEDLTNWYEDVLALDEVVLTGSVVGIAGYFADRASLPDLPGLPRLRSVQRRQLRASLGWATHRLGLPYPDWLRDVADCSFAGYNRARCPTASAAARSTALRSPPFSMKTTRSAARVAGEPIVGTPFRVTLLDIVAPEAPPTWAVGARLNPGPHQFHAQPDHFRAWARRRGHLFCRLSDVREIMRPVPIPGDTPRWGLCDGLHREAHEFVPA